MLKEGISFYEHVTNEIVGVYVIFYFIFLMVIMGDNVQNGFENPLLDVRRFRFSFPFLLLALNAGDVRIFSMLSLNIKI